MKTKIWVRQVRVKPDTGHITVRLQSETVRGNVRWLGPMRDYGMDADTFHGRFAGDIEQLKSYFAGQHRAIMGVHVGLVEQLTKMEGEVIG